MSRSIRRLILLVLSIPLLVVVFGVLYSAGMARLEGSPRGFWSGLAWAAETLTTTGYGADAEWRHPAMNLFVMAVQFIGVFLVFLVFPVYLIPFLEERFEARLPRRVAALRGHIVIYRYGAAVMSLVRELRRVGVPYLIVEEAEAEARHLVDEGEPVLYRQLEDDSLGAAHLASARALIANGADEENAAVILGARQAGFRGEVLALVAEPVHRQPMMLAGASGVFTPRHVLAAALADRASDRVSPRLSGGQLIGRNVEVVEIQVRPGSELAGRTLGEAGAGARSGATVIGQWVEGRLTTLPSASTVVAPRGILVVVGSPESVGRLAALAGYRSMPRGSGPIVIAGYGEVGRKVAELLRGVGEEIRIVERSAGPGVDVAGNALDAEVLARAGVREARAVVLALDSDAATLFATVIVRDLAADVAIIARVNQAANVRRIHQAGAGFALSISQVAGQILAHRLLGEEIVSIDPQLRLMKVKSPALEGKHPAELGIRERTGCSVVVVERGEEALNHFDGTFRFAPGDSVYVCGSEEATERFQQVFAPA